MRTSRCASGNGEMSNHDFSKKPTAQHSPIPRSQSNRLLSVKTTSFLSPTHHIHSGMVPKGKYVAQKKIRGLFKIYPFAHVNGHYTTLSNKLGSSLSHLERIIEKKHKSKPKHQSEILPLCPLRPSFSPCNRKLQLQTAM